MLCRTVPCCRTDPKESERKKLADLLKAAAAKRAQDTNGQGPQLWVLDLQVRFTCGMAAIGGQAQCMDFCGWESGWMDGRQQLSAASADDCGSSLSATR